MKRPLLITLCAFAMAAFALAQVTTDPDIQGSIDGAYARVQPQTLNSAPTTLNLDTDPTMAPNADAASTSTPNHGQSIVGNPGGVPGVQSIQNFTRSFTAFNQTFPFTMIGNEPSLGHTTSLPAKVTAITLQLLNPDGSVLTTVSADTVLSTAMNSPNFEDSEYTSGHGQFADAVQRAEFFNSMKQNWHTELRPSLVVDDITLQIPATVPVRIGGNTVNAPTYLVRHAPDGETVVLMLNLYFDQIILPTVVNNEINAGNFTTDALNILFLNNTFLFGLNRQGVPSSCCTLGFHTYFLDPSTTPQPRWMTIYASWTAPGFFRGGIQDVTALSHEISETFNDPFLNNIVPRWQFPGEPGACQGNLETGDPVEVLNNATVSIPIHVEGIPFTYHPQTEALLQWFEEISPSDALGGAYSYPNANALTAPATHCP